MVFLTGATGFVGQNLLKRLIYERIKTRCLVRDTSKTNKSDYVELVEGGLSDKAVLEEALYNVETVVHLAAAIKSSDPEEFIKINVQGTENLVKACRKNKAKRIIYISSLDAALKETTIYGKTKAAGENIVRNSGMDYIIIRPALIYGKSSKDIDMLAKFVKMSPFVPVAGNGKGKLQPVYIDDICDILFKLIKSDTKNKTYYVAGEQKISLNELIDKIAFLSSKKIVKIHIPLWLLWLPIKLYGLAVRHSQVNYESLILLNQDKTCDTTEIKEDFNFAPKNIDDGLRLALQNS